MQKLHLEFGGYSDAGVKASNDDAFTAYLPTEHSARKYKGGAACIADGVSCSANAQLASQTAVTNFAADYFSTPDFWTVQQSAAKVIGAINSWLHQHGRQSQTRADGFVTTFSALIIKSHTAHILHTGDSRIYLLRDHQLELLTEDHCIQHGSASCLTRALGIENRLDLDYRSLQVKVGDRFLLTTDGVHDAISDKRLCTVADQQGSNLEQLAKTIGQTALEAGSEDNISCLLVDVATLPIERIDEIYRDLTDHVIPPVLESGNTIDQFEIVRVIHSGTRSHVYLARDMQTAEQRILKMPSPSFAEDIEYLDSFAREEWVGRKLAHPQIMKIDAPPQNSKFLYHVCEYIEGKTLRQWMTDNPKPDVDQVRDLLDAMIIPVRALHRDKMIHRDLKPENFIIKRDGRITLIDFGTIKVSGIEEISRPLLEELPVGDVGYVAPEYLVHGSVTRQSDLFSIACIVYELISSQLPYTVVKSNRNYPQKFAKWQYTSLNSMSPSLQGIPDWIDNVLKKALAPNPVYRYQALSEFQHDLRSPGQDILKSKKFVPLMESHPLRFWQTTSLILLIIVILQWVL